MAIWVKWRATSEAKDTCRSAPMGLTTNHLLHDEATHKSCLWKSPQTPGGTGTLTFKLYFIWKQKNTPSNIPFSMPSAYGPDFAGQRKSSSSQIRLCHYGTLAVYFTIKMLQHRKSIDWIKWRILASAFVTFIQTWVSHGSTTVLLIHSWRNIIITKGV